MLHMVDSTSPILPPPPGVTVAAGYLGVGNGESRAWTPDDWARAMRLYPLILPIAVAYLRFDKPEADAARAVQLADSVGIHGGTISLDIEAKVAARARAAGYVPRWAHELVTLGRSELIYTSRSTASVGAGFKIWGAGYDGRADLEGFAAHQLDDTGGGGAWDDSVIDETAVPLWATSGPQPSPSPAPTPITGGVMPAAPLVVTDPLSRGYWHILPNGEIHPFGVPVWGDLTRVPLAAPIVDADVTPAGDGLILLGRDGGVFCFGAAQNHGNASTLGAVCTAIRLTSSGAGYFIAAQDGGVFSYGDAKFLGHA